MGSELTSKRACLSISQFALEAIMKNWLAVYAWIACMYAYFLDDVDIDSLARYPSFSGVLSLHRRLEARMCIAVTAWLVTDADRLWLFGRLWGLYMLSRVAEGSSK